MIQVPEKIRKSFKVTLLLLQLLRDLRFEFLRTQILTPESVENSHKSSVTNKAFLASNINLVNKNSAKEQINPSVDLTQTQLNKDSFKSSKVTSCLLCA